jgi:beta-glucuronidase
MNIIQNPYARDHILLNGAWHYIVDPYETGYLDMFGEESEHGYFENRTPEDHWASEYNFSESPTLNVPGDWNTQVRELFWFEGTLWYYRELPKFETQGKRTFLRFGGVNYESVVWVNGQRVVKHTGGFTPFEAEITELLNDHKNFVVVKVNNERLADGVPTKNTDWWNYGGITRDVLLIQTSATFIRDYFCQLDVSDENLISGHVQIDGDQGNVTFCIAELGISEQLVADAKGFAAIRVAASPDKWSPESPRLYDVVLQCGDDKIQDRIGFRTIKTSGEDILLNGAPIFLKGISTHEEAIAQARRAHSETDAREIFAEIKALGCNFARLAHYTHNDFMTRVADEVGILLWCEVPVYWSINWGNRKVLDNARNQLSEMVVRDRNRASIILWSVANETPTSEKRTAFIRTLAETAKQLDPVRLTTAAMFMRPEKIEENGKTVRTYTLDDPLAEHLDVMGCNQYLGWYYTKLSDIAGARWISDQNKP